MIRLLCAAVALSTLLTVSAPQAVSTDRDNTCRTALEGYQVLPDTASSVPGFFFGGRLRVDRLLVCEDGVFFFFRAREWGHYMRFVLAWHKPDTDRIARYFGRDETDPVERTKTILEATTISLKNYNEYLDQLRRVLGWRYTEGRFVSFDNERYKAILVLAMGSPIEFSWRHRTASCQPLMDLYFVPTSQTPNWAVFLLLFPGRW